MALTVLIAPSGFKESLSVGDVTEAIARGVERAIPDARCLRAPMVDGGEGFVEALVGATSGTLVACEVTGPVGRRVPSFYGWLGSGHRTAVIEMAAAAGLRLVPRNQRDPTKTTSYGVGELVRHALDGGAERILIGCGDSGINDGGAGMAQALGARLLDDRGNEIGRGGDALSQLAKIDTSALDPRLRSVQFDAAVNWHNMLLGERGVARVFGPQKGATPAQVVSLERGLANYAAKICETISFDVAQIQGSGASGGLGAGLAAFCGATLHPRFDIVMKYLNFDAMLRHADLLITAEGSLDGQSPYGKVPCEVGRRARERGIPVIALAGTIGEGVVATFDHGIDAFASILKRPCTLDEAIEKAPKLLERAAEDAMRMVLVGQRLGTARTAAERRTQAAAALSVAR